MMPRGLISDDDPLAGAGTGDEDPIDEKKDLSTPKSIVEEIAKNGAKIINEWHDQIVKEPPLFDMFLDQANSMKNRYPNVILYDKTRVRLRGKPGEDYYHASYVDSYEKARDYILAQAPFDSNTENDFWRLAYQVQPRLIVLLTALENRDGGVLVRKFFPGPKQQREYGDGKNLSVQCTRVDQENDNDTYEILLLGPGQRSNSAAKIPLIHYKKWVDDSIIPDNLLEFRAFVKIANARAKKSGRNGPIILMCPTGVHRCGTFTVLDIVLDRLATEKKVGLLETTTIVRSQRYGCMAHFAHYSHVADLIVRHAVSSGIANIDCVASPNKK
ncbi:Tyrosine-protein phosphatase Lar-like [Toxocara canis]|uniref:Tyrosine-protein phosphatase Lar-like n=1 Tax=Toxocara canis TaxID=6265 RepID=A0A0B2UW69_TOXCA|nr:Tyrosine-protein phosphatase Lar-like [Toxocara canis]